MSCVVDDQQSVSFIFVIDEVRQVSLHLHLRQLRLWAICFACQASLANSIVIDILKDSLKLRNLSYFKAGTTSAVDGVHISFFVSRSSVNVL